MVNILNVMVVLLVIVAYMIMIPAIVFENNEKFAVKVSFVVLLLIYILQVMIAVLEHSVVR